MHLNWKLQNLESRLVDDTPSALVFERGASAMKLKFLMTVDDTV